MGNKFRNLIMLLTVSFLTVLSIFYFPDKSYSIDNITYTTSNQKLELAPYSDEYLKWLSLSDDKKELVPAPKISDQPFVSLYETSLFGKTRSIVEDGVLPTQYDLRNVKGVNYTTPIKDQGLLGLCWAYSSSSALESNLKLNGQVTYNFNPIHANYLLANHFLGDFDNPYGMMELNTGGNFEYVNGYWGSGFGPTTNFSGNGTTPVQSSSVYDVTNNIQVEDTYILPSFNNSEATALERQEYNNIIKRQIMDNGGVYFHAAAPSGLYYNDAYDSVYTDNFTDYYNSPHAMIIIGWDDNYSRTKFNAGRTTSQSPMSNGAWIVQNSWGTSLGDNGYYYYSYEDYMIGVYMAGIISASSIDYDNIYQYNPTGSNLQLSGSYAGVVFNKEDIKTENLTEVSFYVNEPNMNYEIYVNPIDGELNGDNVKLVYTSSSPVEFVGYHTVNLDMPVELKGKEFAIIVHFISSEYYIIPVRENSHIDLPDELVGIMAEQNFVSFDGTNWNDLYYSDYDISLDIKGYTEDVVYSNNVNIDSSIQNDIVVIDASESDNIIGVSTIVSNAIPGQALSYKIKDAKGNSILSTTTTINPIIRNHSNALITFSNTEPGNYTLETYYSAPNAYEMEVDYFTITNSESIVVTDVINKLDDIYIELNTTKDLNGYIETSVESPLQLNWVSSNPSVVSVTNGVISGLNVGTSTITVTDQDGLLSDTILVTVNNVIEINNLEDLKNIKNNLTGSYRLTSDIDITGVWTPIGGDYPFIGTFDGNGYVIRGLNTTDANYTYNGLFSRLYGATINQVTLLNSSIVGKKYNGALAGYIELSELNKIFISNGSISGDSYSGGIAGYITDSVISKSFNANDVTGQFYTGGITGYINKTNVNSSYNIGSIEGVEKTGGLFGGAILSHIERVYNKGNVHATNHSIGGIIGYGEDFDIINSYNSGVIMDSTSSYIGGIVGFANTSESGQSLIKNTYNIGNIVNGNIHIGGIFGSSGLGLEVINNYDISDTISAYGETGYATITNTIEQSVVNLKNQITFIGFDFNNYWIISTDQYPTLRDLPILNDITISNSSFNLDIGDTRTITVQFLPDTVLNKIISWESSNKGVAIVNNGLITAVGPGNATVTIKSIDGSVTKTISITVDSPISSNEYAIYSNYISEVSNETLLENFVEQINVAEPETSIKIYESDGITECTTGIIGTNMILETTNSEKTIRFDIIVKGDVTGDGYVRVNDIIRINNHIIGYSSINNNGEVLAADVTGDNSLRVNDIVKINNYIINPLLNPLIEGN